MKGNKKLLIVAVLLLLIAVSYSTYAIYKSSATSSDSIRPAHWVVSANNTNIVANNTFTLGTLDCTGGAQVAKASGTIAPGDSCQATITIDADGSEVDVTYAIEVDSAALTALNNSNISVTAHDTQNAPLTGTIAYSATAGQMEKTVVLDIAWTAVDSTTQNPIDIATANGSGLTIPVTVTVTQNPTGITP